MSDHSKHRQEPDNPWRRRVLTRVVQAFAVTGLGFLAWPFVKAWIPSFDEDNSLDVRVRHLKPGEAMTVAWLGRRVLIQRRSNSMLEYFRIGGLDLKDAGSEQSRQPAFATNRFRSLREDYFVAFNNCTHLGCEVARASDEPAGVGFECPCHQSLYDHAGRVVRGAAAPVNLEIPAYSFVSRHVIKLESEIT